MNRAVQNIFLLIALIVLVVIAAALWQYKPITSLLTQQQMNPVATSSWSTTLPNVYTYSGQNIGFTINYPANWSVDAHYEYQELGPGREIGGVKFTIPKSIATGTNLASDSYVSVEYMSTSTACSADLFLDQGALRQPPATVVDNDVTYSVASSTGAGAGNRYEETVYAIPGTSPCVAVRYFIHYGVIENYPTGAVQQFDEAALKAQFDQIRRSLVLGK